MTRGSVASVRASGMNAAAVPCAASSSYTPAHLWHLLSLDAPTVAALWTLFLARCAGVILPWSCVAGMFVAVWILYAADRLLDARAAQRQSETNGLFWTQLEERHRFHWKHRRPFVVGLAIAGVALAALIPEFGARTIAWYTGLGFALLLWLAWVHLPSTGRPASLPKEFMVGPFFGLAIAVPTLVRAPEEAWWLWPCVALFAALCSLNCVLLYMWEHERLLPGRAHASTFWAVHHVRSMGAVLAGAGVTIAALIVLCVPFSEFSRQRAEVPIACALATCTLLVLHRERGRFDRLTLRTAADAALLAPLLFPVLLRR